MVFAICFIVLLILAINACYFIVFSTAAFAYRKARFDQSYEIQTLDVLVVFPVYRSDSVILDSVSKFQKQEYAGKFQTVVIADELKAETQEQLRQIGAIVCPILPSEQRNKARAINIMLGTIKEDYDICIIMDADNLVENDFVEKMSLYFTNGSLAVQARRVAKNNDTRLAQLDTFSEIINNHIFRKGQTVLGLSSSLIGSGMAFDFALFRNVMRGMDVFSGFDKELELRLLGRKVKIAYAEDILVYDEKISGDKAFVNQKRRWLYAQFYFLKNNFFSAIARLLSEYNVDYANKVFQFILLPRIISIGLCGLMILITPFVSLPLAVFASTVGMIQVLALALPLYGQISMKNMFDGIIGIPAAFINMIYALLTSGRASKKFLHTPHN